MVALLVILAIAVVGFAQARTAAPEEKASTGAADSQSRDFALRYARAQLKLAEIRLQKAQEMNRRIPQTLAKGVIEQFADDVEFAKAQLRAADTGGSVDGFGVWKRQVELELADREESLKIAEDANRRVPGVYQPIDLERMRAAVELAKLRVERAASLADASPDARLAWQLEMMQEGLTRVDQMVTLSLQNRLSEFY
jgi:hypothetical protein